MKSMGVIYASERVANRKRRFGQATHYVQAQLVQAGRDPLPLLLTTDQLREAADRAKDNPEDLLPFESEADRTAAANLEEMRSAPRLAEAERDWLVPAVALVALGCGFALGALL